MRSSFAGLAAIAGASMFVAAAGATPPQQASGSGVATAPALTNVRLADGNILADFTQTGVLTGTFAGTLDTTGRLVVFPDGRVLEQASAIVFTGTTPCGTGVVVFKGNGRLTAGVGTARVFTVDGATTTVDIHSVDDLVLAGPAFTYSGSYHCGD